MKSLALASCLIALVFAAGSIPESQADAPGISPCRMAAEWEPVIGSIIAWPLIIPQSLVVELAEGDMQLYVMVSDEIGRYAAEKAFKQWGMNMDNVHFVVTRLGLAWGWQSFDGLHCRVRAIWDPGMLRMANRRMDSTVKPAKSWPVEVTIRDFSKAGLIPEELQLHVRSRSDQRWQTIILSSTANPNLFQASIPGVRSGKTVEYYLSAADRSGRRETLPRTAPDNFYSFTVK